MENIWDTEMQLGHQSSPGGSLQSHSSKLGDRRESCAAAITQRCCHWKSWTVKLGAKVKFSAGGRYSDPLAHEV